MKYLFFGVLFFFYILPISGKSSFDAAPALTQNFESAFRTVNSPAEFLPGWTGNVVLSSSRIFQAAGLGRGGGNSLAVQTIATFDGELVTRLTPKDFDDPQVQFYSRSLKNGTGNRPVLVYYSWSTNFDSGFSTPKILGTVSEFANENQDYRKFQIEMPTEFDDLEVIFLKFQIRYGAGSGSSARWFLDDFVFGDIIEDTLSPVLVSARGYDQGEIELRFSEKLDTLTSRVKSHYVLGGISPINITIKQDSLVMLDFGDKLENRGVYNFDIRGLLDRWGNVLRDTVFQFTFFDPTVIPLGGLVINELMPAPREELVLPNVEYVELYHAGDYAYRLENFRWSNSRTEVMLGNEWVDPGEYVLVLSSSQRSLMQGFGRVIGLSSWPTLLNGADRVTLKDDKGELIDQIRYSTSSWGGSNFASGGFSLEVVNPFSRCDQSDYLVVSKDTLRGTPGRANSVVDMLEDLDAPVLLDSRFGDRKSIVLSFSEGLQPDVMSASFVFTPHLNLDSVVFNRDQIYLYGDIEENVGYEVLVSGVMDCFGNVYSSLIPLKFFLPAIAKSGELFLNEVLFHGLVGEPKFVELRNGTDKSLEIGNWKLANLDGSGLVSQSRDLSTGSLVIEGGGYLAITTDTLGLRVAYPKSRSGKFHQVSSLPSYPISLGTVVLLDAQNQQVERFGYDQRMHHPLIREVRGVSLERLSIETGSDVGSNWQSASSVEEYATPGRENSQVISAILDAEMIKIEPEVFDPEGSNGLSFAMIHYELDQAGWVGSFKIYNLGGQVIGVLAENEILGVRGFFSWTGTDDRGVKVRPGYYVLLVELFDPFGSVKYIRKTVVVGTRL